MPGEFEMKPLFMLAQMIIYVVLYLVCYPEATSQPQCILRPQNNDDMT